MIWAFIVAQNFLRFTILLLENMMSYFLRSAFLFTGDLFQNIINWNFSLLSFLLLLPLIFCYFFSLYIFFILALSILLFWNLSFLLFLWFSFDFTKSTPIIFIKVFMMKIIFITVLPDFVKIIHVKLIYTINTWRTNEE